MLSVPERNWAQNAAGNVKRKQLVIAGGFAVGLHFTVGSSRHA